MRLDSRFKRSKWLLLCAVRFGAGAGGGGGGGAGQLTGGTRITTCKWEDLASEQQQTKWTPQPPYKLNKS